MKLSLNLVTCVNHLKKTMDASFLGEVSLIIKMVEYFLKSK